MLKADFHMHCDKDMIHYLDYSPKELIDHCKKLGYDVMAITPHDCITYSKELFDYAKKKGILLLSGIEMGIDGKHVLILNVTSKDVEKVKTFDDIRKLKKKKNIVVIAAHPFFPGRTNYHENLEKNIDVFDAIEFSHFYRYLVNFNKRAMKVAVKYNKPIVGTSDCHHLYQIGYTYTVFDCKKDVKSVLDAIRKGNGRVITRPFPLFLMLKILYWMFIGEKRQKRFTS